jgi:hypothetical protein
MITIKSQEEDRVMKDERLTVLCGIYNELHIEEKKRMEKIAVRLFNSQMAVVTVDKEQISPAEKAEVEKKGMRK